MSNQQEEEYSSLFAPFLSDSSCLFVISSDFCHWGKRFNYTFGAEKQDPIHETIRQLDERGMK